MMPHAKVKTANINKYSAAIIEEARKKKCALDGSRMLADTITDFLKDDPLLLEFKRKMEFGKTARAEILA